MSEHNVNASIRKDEGKGASRRLRHAGQVPAIIYGGTSAPVNIQIEHNHLWHVSQSEWFYASILSLNVDGKSEQVLLRDMQRHPFKQQIMHLDFQRVDANHAIRFNVPLHFLNQEKSPAGKTANVIVTHELHEIAVVCLPRDLPEFISVDLSALTAGDIIHMSDITLPANVENPALKLGKEHDLAVVIAKFARGTDEDTAAAEASEVPSTKSAKAGAAPADSAKKK
ncbi:MAG TPA: 50S ribosomal protein L25/general stress protein Ctc [Arenimonas sp.]|nr:50S ribosomal protein L25/general stress protein Ctc [Arenimonas sp.]